MLNMEGHLRSVLAAGVLGLLLVTTGCSSHRAAGSSGRAVSVGLIVRTVNAEADVAKLRSDLKRQPRNADLHRDLALVLYDAGDERGAAVEMEAAVALSPKDPHFRYDLAQFCAKAGRKPEALRSALLAAELVQPRREGAGLASLATSYAPIYSQYAADLSKDSGQYTKAERMYERTLAQLGAYAMEWKMSNLDRLSSSGHLSEDMRGHAQRELRDVRRVLERSRPDETWVWAATPHIRISWSTSTSASQEKQARIREEQIARGEVSGDHPHSVLGDYYLYSGKPDRAVIRYLAAIQLSPRSVVSWSQLGLAYLRMGRLDDAADAFQTAANLGDGGASLMAKDARAALKRYRTVSLGKERRP